MLYQTKPVSSILNWAFSIKEYIENMRRNILTILYFIGFPLSLSAQMDSVEKADIVKPKFCNPYVEGMGPSKAVSIFYERAGNSQISSVSKDSSIGNAQAKVIRNNRFNVDLKIPFANKPDMKVIGGLRYFYEEFDFKNTTDSLGYAFYHNIESKHLKSVGTDLSILRSINETKYWVARVLADLNGDFTNKQFAKSSFLKMSFAFLYGKKECETKTTAFGFYINYALGRQYIFPVLLYNNTYSKRWGVEALAPAFIKGRYNFSDKALLYFGYELEGASYNLFIHNPEIVKYNSLQLRRSTIRYELQFQREINKFIWISFSAGLRQTLSFNVTTKSDKSGHISFHNGIKIVRGDPLIRNTLGLAPLINVSIFAVVPKSMLNKVVYTKGKNQ
jgi:hypothetical protein